MGASLCLWQTRGCRLRERRRDGPAKAVLPQTPGQGRAVGLVHRGREAGVLNVALTAKWTLEGEGHAGPRGSLAQ